jgi:hypothetical protein
MVARSSLPLGVQSHAGLRSSLTILGAGIVLILTVFTPDPALAHRGMWASSGDSMAGNDQRYAVHMMLVPGDNNPYHSRIVWFRGEAPGQFNGAEWGWLTGNDGCSAFPGDRFVNLGLSPSGDNIFCSGTAQLADGRGFIAGGEDPVIGEYGNNLVRIYTRGSGSDSGSWSNPGNLAQWRWYPSVTALRDSRVMVAGGSMFPHHRLFGGKRNGVVPPDSVADSLYRFAPVVGGRWDVTVIPSADGTNGRPAGREGHTFVETDGAADFADGTGRPNQVLFGGRKSDGLPLADTWFLSRDNNPTGADYTYAWKWQNLSNPPAKRSYHTAVVALNNSMVIYGGFDQDSLPRSDVHRLYKDATGFHWSQVTTSGTAPSARCGHTAIYDELLMQSGQERRRMIVFGGTSAPGQTPTDSRVWELRWDDPGQPNSATWSVMDTVDLDFAPPIPRYWHTANQDSGFRSITVNQVTRSGHTAFVFGGALGGGAYSDTLWALWIFNDGKIGWKRLPIDGTPPGARARHSATLDPGQGGGRLYIFGGEMGAARDSFTYAVDVWTWNHFSSKWNKADFTLAGHTAVLDNYGSYATYSRVSEVFDPQTSQFQAYTNAPHLFQLTYPLNFAVPGGTGAGGRIITVGQESQAYWLDLPAAGQSPQQGWQTFGGDTLNSGFFAQTGVMYRPGRIMIAGGPGPTGTTKTLNALSLSSGWTTSGSMVPRVDHNLVLLPDGKVLAVGGNESGQTSLPVRSPQIWDPDASAGGVPGVWSDATALAEQPSSRPYHSTAILLPDGRVLSGGGESAPDKFRFDVFCPPYLFKGNSDTLAARPTISSAPASLTWGEIFTVCTSDTTGIKRVCLIRPGATTHSFDQNERYVPLTFSKVGNPARLLVQTPAGPDSAPPGDYMLFLTGSPDGPDVPSIARWVRLLATAGADSCDPVAPAAIADLSGCYHYYNPNAGKIDLSWTAPADDGTLAASGQAKVYDIRWSNLPITTDTQFNNATAVSPSPPLPATVGTLQTHQVGNFSQNTTYYFRMKTRDDRGDYVNESAMSNQAVVITSTDCDDGDGLWGGSVGGGGGGMRARPVAGAASGEETTSGTYVENSLLDGARSGARATDVCRLAATPAIQNGAYDVRVRQSSSRTTAIDVARLLVVDHSAGVSAYGVNGDVVLGNRIAPARVTAQDGSDLTALLDGGSELTATVGETLTVQLGRAPIDPEATSALVLIEAAGPVGAGSAGGIVVQAPDGSGGWQTLGPRYPRRNFDELVVGPVSGNTVRLVPLGNYRLRFVGSIARSSARPELQWPSLLSAQSRKRGEARADLASADTASYLMAGPDTVALGFAVAPQAAGQEREFFLAVEATPVATKALAPSLARSVGSSIPARFALHQNQPNPFRARTTIKFELPVGAMVRLEVFDLLGRRVRVLANRYYPPGYQSVEWDQHDAAGAQVGPGVYFYRIEAGAMRDRKKMLLLP